MSRRAVIVAHQWSEKAPAVAAEVGQVLRSAGWSVVTEETDDGSPADIAVVVGGDGTFLRAAELVRGRGIALLGINLGHVGFLTQADVEGVRSVLGRVVRGDYSIEERATIGVDVLRPGARTPLQSWALNEAAIEKVGPGRMLEVALEVDARPISTFGCDGVVVATPTGSTAHAFSAGGPVLWPDVDAFVIAPLCAHALFARPLVVSPRSVAAVEILARSLAPAMVSFDGRRSLHAPAGSRIEVRRSEESVRLVRLDSRPFADTLVRKFSLPVAGWRGGAGDVR